MSLPVPIPDNPKKWDGWRNFNSENLYDRLCLSYDSNPSEEQIEDHCRQLLIWWQKKLPLKNQPSNPVTQMLRAGLDEAAHYLAEARTKLLDPEIRKEIDVVLRGKVRDRAFEEFTKFFIFATANGTLSESDENNLYQVGIASGLSVEEMRPLLEAEMAKRGISRLVREEPPPAAAAPAGPAAGSTPSVFDDFRRLLRLSGLSDDDMTDDQRDALCNMGENLGMTGGQAEDLIDEYLEEVSGVPLTVPSAMPRHLTPVASRPQAIAARSATPASPGPRPTLSPKGDAMAVAEPQIQTSPLARAREREKYPAFANAVGMEMLLVPSGTFEMGSAGPEAAPNEQPVTRVALSCFHMSRFPVTNAQFEQFDPSHVTRRATWADDNHPVVYVSTDEAIKFCRWLSLRERKEYRLPTEAEWEYAARGSEGRIFPWGGRMVRGDLVNFADVNTQFAWRDPNINDGFAETAPVGSFPRGASPFGIEDMAGNVWEWCLDFFENYRGKDRVNPRGPQHGTRRIYRGGSWKSRAGNLRTSARNFNLSNFSANDVGFRIVCECS